MEFSINFNIVKLGWSIIYIEGSLVIISEKCIFSLKIDFVLANSADSYEMQHYAAFHLDLHCLTKYLFRRLRLTKGLAYFAHNYFKISECSSSVVRFEPWRSP